MRIERIVGITALAAALWLATAHAQQAPPATPSPAAPARPAPADAPPPGDASKPAAAEKPSAKPAAGAKSSPQHFEPTEKVRPDFDVAFPVDI